MTDRKNLQQAFDHGFELVKRYVDAEVKELRERVEALEAGGIAFKGVWQRAQSYKKGDTCTADGALWVALKSVPEGCKPGSDAEHWQLCAKGKPRRSVTAGMRKHAE